MLRLILVLTRASPGLVVVAVGAALASGLATAALLGVINSILSSTPGDASPFRYALLCAVVLIAGVVAQTVIQYLSGLALFRLRSSLCHQICAVPLRDLERVGPARLLASLTEDVPAVANALGMVPVVAAHLTSILAANVYLAVLAPSIFAVWFLILGAGLLTAYFLMRLTEHLDRPTRTAIGELYEHFRAIVEGAKELRLDRQLRRAFLSEAVDTTAESVRRHATFAHAAQAVEASWARLLLYASIGGLLFLHGTLGLSQSVAAAFIMVSIFMLSPLAELFSFVPWLNRGIVALDALRGIGLALAAKEPTPEPPAVRPSIASLELCEVIHSYTSDQENRVFRLGPIDLRFGAGKVVFIVGGNGSGKSTLAKILCGLYVPEHGEVLLNGQPITEENREWYRQHFSAVFPDYYLFDRVWGLAPDAAESVPKLLSDLRLEKKVGFQNGKFSSTALSHGQRKRLALICAYLTDRPVYVFDEWAADQDPMFKRLFYTTLVKGLKARGKLVFVVSHDDRYFKLADEMVKLEDGQKVDDSTAQFLSRLSVGHPES